VTGSGTADLSRTPIEAVTCRDEGPSTVIEANGTELVVVRVIGADLTTAHTLTGTWSSGGPAVLAGVNPA
jgi:hypothetical protein